jgi:hypothetical protein
MMNDGTITNETTPTTITTTTTDDIPSLKAQVKLLEEELRRAKANSSRNTNTGKTILPSSTTTTTNNTNTAPLSPSSKISLWITRSLRALERRLGLTHNSSTAASNTTTTTSSTAFTDPFYQHVELLSLAEAIRESTRETCIQVRFGMETLKVRLPLSASGRELQRMIGEYWGITEQEMKDDMRMIDARDIWMDPDQPISDTVGDLILFHAPPVPLTQQEQLLVEESNYNHNISIGSSLRLRSSARHNMFRHSNTNNNSSRINNTSGKLKKQSTAQSMIQTTTYAGSFARRTRDETREDAPTLFSFIPNIADSNNIPTSRDPVLFTARRVWCDCLATLTLFLLLTCWLALGFASGNSIEYLNKATFACLFTTGSSSSGSTFSSSLPVTNSINNFWLWVQGPLKNTMFPPSSSTNFLLSGNSGTTRLFHNVVRLRTIHVKPIPCAYVPPLPGGGARWLSSCYPGYNIQMVQSTPNEWGASTYFNDNTGPVIYGTFATYGTEGYVMDLFPNSSDPYHSWDLPITQLQQLPWIDNSTRLVTAEFIAFNANDNVVVDALVALEQDVTGLVEPIILIRSVHIITSMSNQTGFTVVFSLFLFYTFVQEMQYLLFSIFYAKQSRAGGNHDETALQFCLFGGKLNSRVIINVFIIGFGAAGIAIQHSSMAQFVHLVNSAQVDGTFESFMDLVQSDQMGYILLGMTDVFVSFKLYTYIADDILPFRVLLDVVIAWLISLLAFALLGFTLSNESKSNAFSSIGSGILALIRLFLGGFSVTEIDDITSSPAESMSLYFVFMLTVGLILVRLSSSVWFVSLAEHLVKIPGSSSSSNNGESGGDDGDNLTATATHLANSNMEEDRKYGMPYRRKFPWLGN